MSLTPKAIPTIYSRPNDSSMRPILQVLSVSTLAGQPGRFKIVLSDGEFYSTGLLASQLIQKYGGCPFKQYQLVSVDEYQVNTVQDKAFLLIHGMTEISPPMSAGQLGNPQVYRPNPSTLPVTGNTAASAMTQPPAPVAVQQLPPTHNPYAPVHNPYGGQPGAAPVHNPYGGQPGAAPVHNPYGPSGGADQASPFHAPQTNFVNPYQQKQSLPSHSPFAAGMAQTSSVVQQAYTGQTAGPVRYLQATDAVVPMNQLTIYTQKWTIKARVANKSEMRTFRNAKGEGQLMNVELVDQQQSELRATFFGSAAAKFHPMLQVGKVYTFSKGSVKPANPRFNPKAQYELMFDEHSEIVLVPDDANIPVLKVSLVPVKSLADVPVGETVDIAGVVLSVGEAVTVTIKSTGRDTAKRNITVGDDSGCSIDLTVWGEKAQRIGDEVKLKDHPVIFAKGCRLGDYNGRSLSTAGSSLVEVEPNHPRTAELRNWWARGGSATQFTALTASGGGGFNAGGGVSKRVTIQTMRQEDVSTLAVANVGFGDPSKRQVNSHTVKATLVHIPVRDGSGVYYKSCATEVDDGRGGRRLCQKKAEQQGDVYVCAEQHMNRTANARFILSMRIQDATGECLVRAFHDQGKSILGVDASEIDQSPDPAAAQQFAVEQALFKPYVFKIRSKKEIHMDEEKLNMVLTDAQPLAPHADALYMLSNVKNYLNRIGAAY